MNKELKSDFYMPRKSCFGIVEDSWNLSFDYLGNRVSIEGKSSKEIKSVKMVGENMYIHFQMENMGTIDEIIQYAKLHIDEYIEDYKREMGLLN